MFAQGLISIASLFYGPQNGNARAPDSGGVAAGPSCKMSAPSMAPGAGSVLKAGFMTWLAMSGLSQAQGAPMHFHAAAAHGFDEGLGFALCVIHGVNGGDPETKQQIGETNLLAFLKLIQAGSANPHKQFYAHCESNLDGVRSQYGREECDLIVRQTEQLRNPEMIRKVAATMGADQHHSATLAEVVAMANQPNIHFRVMDFSDAQRNDGERHLEQMKQAGSLSIVFTGMGHCFNEAYKLNYERAIGTDSFFHAVPAYRTESGHTFESQTAMFDLGRQDGHPQILVTVEPPLATRSLIDHHFLALRRDTRPEAYMHERKFVELIVSLEEGDDSAGIARMYFPESHAALALMLHQMDPQGTTLDWGSVTPPSAAPVSSVRKL